jgi:carbonic anhydrase
MVVLTLLLQALLSVDVAAHEVAKCGTTDGELKYSYDPKKEKGVQWDCETCGTGIQQSPIDIPVDDVDPLPIDLKTEFSFPTNIEGTIKINKGLVVQWDPSGGLEEIGKQSKTTVKFAED